MDWEGIVGGMFKTFYFLVFLGVAGSVLGATDADSVKEYREVVKIALKDPKVQAAFDKAYQKLNERVVEIDPSLKGVVDRQPRHLMEGEPETGAAEKPATAVAASPKSGATHVVAKGETLSSISEHYHVTVAGLKTANHIADERKLRVGQKLVIPGAAGPQATQAQQTGATPRAVESATPHPEAKTEDDGGWWSELKKDM